VGRIVGVLPSGSTAAISSPKKDRLAVGFMKLSNNWTSHVANILVFSAEYELDMT